MIIPGQAFIKRKYDKKSIVDKSQPFINRGSKFME